MYIIWCYQEILIAESTTFEVLPTRNSDNLIEIRNGYFGWSSKVKSGNRVQTTPKLNSFIKFDFYY